MWNDLHKTYPLLSIISFAETIAFWASSMRAAAVSYFASICKLILLYIASKLSGANAANINISFHLCVSSFLVCLFVAKNNSIYHQWLSSLWEQLVFISKSKKILMLILLETTMCYKCWANVQYRYIDNTYCFSFLRVSQGMNGSLYIIYFLGQRLDFPPQVSNIKIFKCVC